MIITSNIFISNREIDKYHLNADAWVDDLSIPNLAYQNAMRFGKRKLTSIPKTLCYLKKSDKGYILPRYYPIVGVPITDDQTVKGCGLNSRCRLVLRDYQQEFFQCHREDFKRNTGILIEASCGSGKCHGKGTKIRMFDGSIKNVEDIVVGDLLMGDDSTPRKVLSLARGREEMFVIHQTKGEDYTVNKSHILSLQYRPWGSKHTLANRNRFAYENYGKVVDICLEDYLNKSKTAKGYLYGYNVAIEYSEKVLPVPAYFIGAWLGDGSSRCVAFTTSIKDRPLIDYYKDIAKEFGCRLRVSPLPNNLANEYHFVGKQRVGSPPHFLNPLLEIFKQLDLIENKHIPDCYLYGSKKQRLELLAGLIDTDGSRGTGYIEITQRRKELVLQIQDLCWSLGYKTHISCRRINGQDYWRLTISGDLSEIPTKLLRKKIQERVINKDPHVTGIRVESIGEGDYYGFIIDGNHRYCLQDGTVTHNTCVGIWISYMRGVKTLVLVPTYYLAQQWEERIHDFTDASVHIIKSTDKEIPIDSDFTIVVMDLFNCRLLPKELVQNIGHVILDEAHRMGAETYIPILDEVPAKYRTALTATFRRRDNAHRILAYHFGTHLFMESRFPKPAAYGVHTGVMVGGLLSKKKPYKQFAEFLDSMGVPYSETKGVLRVVLDSKAADNLRKEADMRVERRQLTKTAHKEICSRLKSLNDYPYTVLDTYLNEHAGRRKMVIRIIQKALDSGRTVLFLSKRKDVLKSMHRYFAAYKPMLVVSETNTRTPKEDAYLKNECRLILGVTQLAKEGLDIDRLDTLIVHLPMADTEQAIGRISRLCEGKKPPMCLYLLDDCPIAYSVFSKAKKSFSINARYCGDLSLSNLLRLL